MAIKLVVLKTGDQIITEAKEILQEERLCGYSFKCPHTVKVSKSSVVLSEDTSPKNEVDVTLGSWILLTEDTEIVVNPDSVVCFATPMESLIEMYEKKVATLINDSEDE